MESPACPRCGYDLSAGIDKWVETCPVGGVCPECGLDYRWGDLLDPQRRVPAWFYEHARDARVSAAIVTVVRIGLPWRFFEDVRLHHRVRVARLVWLILAVAVLSQIALGVSAGALSYGSELAFARLRAQLPAGVQYQPTPESFYRPALTPQTPEIWIGELSLGFEGGPYAPLLAIAWAAPVLLFFVLTDTMRMAKVRFVHLVRVGAYSLVPALLLMQMEFLVMYGEDYNASAGYLARGGQSSGMARLPVDAFRFAVRAFIVVYFAWLSLWWYFSIARYMRLARAWMVFLVMHGTAMFAVAVVYFAFTIWVRH